MTYSSILSYLGVASGLFMLAANIHAQGSEEAPSQEDQPPPVVDSELRSTIVEGESLVGAAFDALSGFSREAAEKQNEELIRRSQETVTVTIDDLPGPSFTYTRREDENPFVPKGSLAYELGVTNTVSSSSSEGISISEDVEIVNLEVNNDRQPEPLEYFSEQKIQYRGRLTNLNGNPVALIAAPDGLLYKAAIGDRVGLSQARVQAIKSDELVLVTGEVTETIPLSEAKER